MTTRKLTIFEGPDGGGKSTLARQFAQATNARYVHFGSFPNVQDLARFYVEGMMPALLGYQDVVFDRSWLSEWPYGVAFRDGKDRIGHARRRTLERLALRCGAIVVKCLPHVETCLANYRSRKEIEMLENEDQLRHVHYCYNHLETDLHEWHFDYEDDALEIDGRVSLVETSRHLNPAHPLDSGTTGNWKADIAIVGDAPSDHRNVDSLLQYPFGSFSPLGSSLWLTQKLHEAKIDELELLWANASNGQDLQYLRHKKHVVALGENASIALKARNIAHEKVPHPQSWKRFNNSKPYPLVSLLKDLTR